MRHLDPEITVTIGEKRQLDRFAYNQRYQTGGDDLGIIVFDKLLLLLTQVFLVDNKDVFSLHLFQHRLIRSRKMLLKQGYLLVQLFKERLGRIVAGKKFSRIFTGTAKPA